MNRFTTGWFKPKPLKKTKPMSFLAVVYCAECHKLSSVSRLGRSCPKCSAPADHVTRASDWDFDKTGVKDLHLGKVVTNV